MSEAGGAGVRRTIALAALLGGADVVRAHDLTGVFDGNEAVGAAHEVAVELPRERKDVGDASVLRRTTYERAPEGPGCTMSECGGSVKASNFSCGTTADSRFATETVETEWAATA